MGGVLKWLYREVWRGCKDGSEGLKDRVEGREEVREQARLGEEGERGTGRVVLVGWL